MNSVVRVLIGDDHRIVREGLKQVLGDPANGSPEITVVAEATQGSEVLEQVTALQGRTGAPGRRPGTAGHRHAGHGWP